MKHSIWKSRTFKAVGTIADIWPAGDYSEYMPKGTVPQRVGDNWSRTGEYLKNAVSKYEQRHTAS